MKGASFASAIVFLTVALPIARAKSSQAASAQTSAAVKRTARADATYRGGMVSPLLAKPKITLTDTSGNPYDLWAKTQGSVTLLFFGYTHCPDMCPLQMSVIANSLRSLPPAVAAEFRVIFITTDPARDTPQVLRAYLNHFDKSFIGLTGSQQAIDAAQIAAKLQPATKGPVRADGAYEVGHAAFVIAYTKDNLAHVLSPVGLGPEDWAHDLPFLATETWSNP